MGSEPVRWCTITVGERAVHCGGSAPVRSGPSRTKTVGRCRTARPRMPTPLSAGPDIAHRQASSHECATYSWSSITWG